LIEHLTTQNLAFPLFAALLVPLSTGNMSISSMDKSHKFYPSIISIFEFIAHFKASIYIKPSTTYQSKLWLRSNESILFCLWQDKKWLPPVFTSGAIDNTCPLSCYQPFNSHRLNNLSTAPFPSDIHPENHKIRKLLMESNPCVETIIRSVLRNLNCYEGSFFVKFDPHLSLS